MGNSVIPPDRPGNYAPLEDINCKSDMASCTPLHEENMRPSVLPEKFGSFTFSYSADKGHDLERRLRFDDAGNMVGEAGSIQFVTVKPGFHILATRTNPGFMPSYSFDIQNMPLTFSFCLSGKVDINFNGCGSRRPASFLNQRGVNALMCLDQSSGHSHYLSDEVSNSVSILLHPDLLADYWGKEMAAIPEECHRILRKRNRLLTLPMTPEMHQVTAEAFSSRYQGSAARLHLESCALELLAMQTDRLTRDRLLNRPCLNRPDEERIRAAAEILIEKMADPPTISTLAGQVGVNESKLRRGFKEVFDLPPLQFLMHQRMTRARELLTSRSLDVTQAASNVGYTNVSHFIICYRRVFGVTPGRHKTGRTSY